MPEAASQSTDRSTNKQLIDMLRRSRLFRDYETVFTKATGLALTLRPLEFWQLPHHGKKHENPFCAMLAERPKTLAVCLQAHQDMIQHTGDLPRTVTCPFGLTETAVPVMLGSETIGYLRIGQVLRHTPAKSDTTKVSREEALKELARVYLQNAGQTLLGELARVTGLSRVDAGKGNHALVKEGFAERLSTGVYRLVNL